MSAPDVDDFLFYNFHPPNEVRIFATPRAAVKRWDCSVLVFDARIGDGILRKYSFADRWFEVHCTFDLNGHLRAGRGAMGGGRRCNAPRTSGRRTSTSARS